MGLKQKELDKTCLGLKDSMENVSKLQQELDSKNNELFQLQSGVDLAASGETPAKVWEKSLDMYGKFDKELEASEEDLKTKKMEKEEDIE